MSQRNEIHLQPLEGYIVTLNHFDPCAVCKDETIVNNYTQGDLILTSCGHLFHYTCITAWENSGAPMANTCPICRFPLDPSLDDIVFAGVEAFPLFIPDGHLVQLH